MLFAKNERIPTVILLCIYTFMCSMHFIDATESGINLFEYLLCCITDHYYLLYALLFFLIAYSAMSSTTVHDTAKIRYGVLGKYYASQIRIRMKKMLVLTFLHLLIPFVIAITKLEYHSGYNIISSGGEIDNNYEVIYFLSRIITNSFMATLCVSVYLYLGMSFISILFAFAFEIWNRKGFIATVVIVLVNVFTGFMTDLNEGMFKFLFLNDYFTKTSHTENGARALTIQ